MARSYRFMVTGGVQGVGFRHACMEKALALGLRGWVRNREDGCVEGQVEGSETLSIDQFRRFLEQGPVAATVHQLKWDPCDPSGESGFRILRD